MIIREKFMELEGVLRTVYNISAKTRVDYIPRFFNVEKSTRSEEKHFGTGSIGLMKPWTGTVTYDNIGKRWETRYRHKKYSNGIQVEREIIDFKEYGEVKRETRQLEYSVYLTYQTHGASVFNNAFDTAYTGADGKPLCAAKTAGHPYAPDNTADTWYNADSLDLTPANIDKVRNAMIDFKDDRGNVLGVQPNALIFGNYYWKKAKEILGSKNVPYEQTNTMNVWNQEDIEPMYLPWLQGKKWFMADKEMMKLYLNWYNARKPVLEYDDNFQTEVAYYKVVGMWSFNWDEAFWLFGNKLD
jgi:hypothetical protein